MTFRDYIIGSACFIAGMAVGGIVILILVDLERRGKL